ncbi:MAG: VCBS repeat-containing protein [Acidimicrobiales bacterium]
MQRRGAILSVVAAAAVVGLAASPAGAGSPVTWGPLEVVDVPTVESVGLDWTTTPTAQWTSTSKPVVLQGDFNADGRDDVFLYVKGSVADQLWLGQPFDEAGGDTDRTGRFAVSTINVSGTYLPFTGDFDGNGATDIFWYAPGTNPDSIWYFEDGEVEASVPVSVNGTYQPIVADFDQNDGVPSDDIFWYGERNAESVWSGRSSQTFQTRTFQTQAPAGAQVLVGNFAPDEALAQYRQQTYFPDLFFYVPGTGVDAQWNSVGNGTFQVVSRTVNGSYRPIVGNFDQGLPGWLGGLSEIFWYAPGTGADTIWINDDGTFVGSKVTVNGRYAPFVVPGTVAADAIVWNNPTGSDSVWLPTGTSGEWKYSSRSFPGSDMGDRTPVVGQFDDVYDDYDYLTVFTMLGLLPTTPGAPLGTAVADPQVQTIIDEMPRADVLWLAAGNGSGDSEVYWRVDGADVTYQQTEVEQPILATS